jgi:hypothetical protein
MGDVKEPIARKPSFRQELYQQSRVPAVMLLLPHISCPNLGRVAPVPIGGLDGKCL